MMNGKVLVDFPDITSNTKNIPFGILDMKDSFIAEKQHVDSLFDSFKYEEADVYLGEFISSKDWNDYDPNQHMYFLFLQYNANFKQSNAVKSGVILQKIQSLLQQYGDSVSEIYRGRVFLASAQMKIAVKNTEDVEFLLYKSIEIFQRVEEEYYHAIALSTLGVIKKMVGDVPGSIAMYSQVIVKLEHSQYHSLFAGALVSLGMIRYDLAEFDLSFECYHKALAIYEKVNDLYGKSAVLVNIGNLYRRLSDNQKALHYYGKALDLNIELNRKTGVAVVNSNLGNVYSSLQNYESALFYYESAFATYEELGNKDPLFTLLMNMGYVYLLMGSYEKAVALYDKAFLEYHVRGNISEELTYCINMSSLYLITGNLIAAKEYSFRGFSLSTGTHDTSRKYEFLCNLGVIEYRLDNSPSCLESSLSKLLECYKYANASNLKTEQSLYALEISKIYTLLKDWKSALEYHQIYHRLESDIKSSDYIRQAEIVENNRKLMESELKQQAEITALREQAKLLHDILPSSIANRIIAGEKSIAEETQSVSIFFSDVVGFTSLAESISPSELVKYLNEMFSSFDLIAHKHGIEKIKTIGDSYMAVCGIPEHKDDHALRMADFAKEVLTLTQSFLFKDRKIEIRIGIHSGPVVAGVIGKNRYSYDLWGDSVNIASRLESTGIPGKIQISESFLMDLSSQGSSHIQVENRGEIEMKGKGLMKAYIML